MTTSAEPRSVAAADVAAPILQVEGVQHRYGDVQALREVSFTVPQGSFFALLGPNGAGKSTLVSLLATLLPLRIGQASVAGFDVRRQSGQVRRQLGLVFQEPSLDERLTVLENLDFHGRIYGMSGRARASRAAQVLELVELSDWQHALTRILSRGMKRRLEIARAVMHWPKLLLLDEPTAGLDVQSRHALWRYLAALQQETGVSLLLTTHQIDEAEAADLVAIIDRGELLRFGHPDALRAAHGGQVARLTGVPAGLRAQLDGVAEVLSSDADRLTLRVSDPERLLQLVAAHPVGALSLHAPSLEDVFLDLTGRGLREDQAGGREATLAFARGGGEHTR